MDEHDFQDRREALVEAALPHIPFDGWSEAALHAGARDSGFDPAFVRRAFPRGAVDAIACHSRLADRRMIEALDPDALAAMRTRDRVLTVIRTRLEQAEPEREAVRRAATVLALPQNAPLAARCVWRTVDAIWYAAGDTATDFNHYTKRGLLAAVYGATVAYWLQDRSDGSTATWNFLERRLDDALRLPQAADPLLRPLRSLPNPVELMRSMRRPHMPRRGRW